MTDRMRDSEQPDVEGEISGIVDSGKSLAEIQLERVNAARKTLLGLSPQAADAFNESMKAINDRLAGDPLPSETPEGRRSLPFGFFRKLVD